MKKVLMMIAVGLMTGVMAMAQENKPCKENCCKGKGKDKKGKAKTKPKWFAARPKEWWKNTG